MTKIRIALAIALLLALAPATAFGGGARKDSVLVKRIAALEERIRTLEERVRALEAEIARLSGRPFPMPPRGGERGDPWSLVAIGMTRDEVRRILGPPDAIAPHSYLEIWDYSTAFGAPCSVTFDEGGRVESWYAPR